MQTKHKKNESKSTWEHFINVLPCSNITFTLPFASLIDLNLVWRVYDMIRGCAVCYCNVPKWIEQTTNNTQHTGCSPNHFARETMDNINIRSLVHEKMEINERKKKFPLEWTVHFFSSSSARSSPLRNMYYNLICSSSSNRSDSPPQPNWHTKWMRNKNFWHFFQQNFHLCAAFLFFRLLNTIHLLHCGSARILSSMNVSFLRYQLRLRHRAVEYANTAKVFTFQWEYRPLINTLK